VAGDVRKVRHMYGGLATSARLRYPSGVAIDASGNIYIADTSTNRILMVTKSTGIITNVAGDGSIGYKGDGGLATSARLRYPTGVAIDASGNIYIADSNNNCIRMVTKSTGIITNVAGDGSYGYSGEGDGGLATSAALYIPTGVFVDASGNIYIADTYNNCIRMVTKSTGIITTVAGDGSHGYSGEGDGVLATSARLNFPQGVAIDASGNIYIADTRNHRIRMVTKSTGIITTVAGNGTVGFSGDGGLATSATLYIPTGVFVDASGNIYIADTNNNRIRMVTKSTGIITTVSGNRTVGFSGDGGLATSARLHNPRGVAIDASGNIYIADTTNRRIRMVTESAGIITTVAGYGTVGFSGDGGLATSATLYYPDGIAIDASGNIYIADSTNHRIRMVTKSTGLITTVAGNGTIGFSGDGGLATSARLHNPRGVAIDASGNIYIADTYNNRIRMVTKSTGIITTEVGNGTSATLYNPSGIAIDTSGNIYIADTYNDRIRMVTNSTGIITTVAGDGFSGDGGLATSARLHNPRAVAIDASGNIYIADTDNHRIRMVTESAGIITTVAGNGSSQYGDYSGDGGLATSATLSYPNGIAIDASGNIYIADTNNNRIRMVTKSTGIITTVAGNGTVGFSGDGGQARFSLLNSPRGIAIDASGNIYFSDSRNDLLRVLLIAEVTTVSSTNSPSVAPTVSSTNSPSVAPTASSSNAMFVASASPGECL
jgi:trimeric autotransporter adhesin